MACNDVLSLQDLQTAKKHDLFHNEVITGKAGGVAGGADIATATNQATGQVQTTLPETLRQVGFKPGSGDFTTGFTVMPGQRDIAWYNPVDKNWYSYLGVIPSPSGHPVAPGTNPVGSVDWAPRTDTLLRDEVNISVDAVSALSSVEAEIGDVLQINGGLSIGDGAHHLRIIESSDDGSGHITANGHWANIAHNGQINISWLAGKFVLAYLNTLNQINFTGDSISLAIGPEDVIPKFYGYGTVNVTDIFGHVQVAKVENILLKNSNPDTFIKSIAGITANFGIGVIGDSITDGGRSKDYAPNPDDSASPGSFDYPNLTSTNYDHSANGGKNSYVAKFGRIVSDLLKVTVSIYNCASSAKKLSNGWAYRNLDYGFFQNAAYGNKMPPYLMMAMGMNDVWDSDYENKIRSFIRKANFYGAEVLWVLPVDINKNQVLNSIEKVCAENNVSVLKLYDMFAEYEARHTFTFKELWWVVPSGPIDVIHPSNSGHIILSNILLYKTYTDRVVYVANGSVIDPARNNNVRTSGISLANLEDVAAYGRVSASAGSVGVNGTGAFELYVWSDDDLDLADSTIYVNNFASAAYIVSFTGLTRSIPVKGRPSGATNTKSLYSKRINYIPLGLSKIAFSVTTGSEGAEVPMLRFTKSKLLRFGISSTRLMSSINDFTATNLTALTNSYHEIDHAPYYGVTITCGYTPLAVGELIALFRNGTTLVGVNNGAGTYSFRNLSTGVSIVTLTGNPNTIDIETRVDGLYLTASGGIDVKLPDEYHWLTNTPLPTSTSIRGVAGSLTQTIAVSGTPNPDV
jgi:hypothetical protein